MCSPLKCPREILVLRTIASFHYVCTSLCSCHLLQQLSLSLPFPRTLLGSTTGTSAALFSLTQSAPRGFLWDLGAVLPVFITTNCSAFCHACLQACKLFVFLLYYFFSKSLPNSIPVIDPICPLLSVILRHLPFLSLCLTIQILCFLALLQLLPLFSFCKVLLLLSSFSLSVLSVLLKAALTDPLLSSA